jgi:hypothetical protein
VLYPLYTHSQCTPAETGFKANCPYEIQAVLIERLTQFGERSQIFPVLWDALSNAPIMMEIHRQSCLLPLSYAPTIKKSMQTWRSWLMVSIHIHTEHVSLTALLLQNVQKNKIFGEQLQTYWQQFIKNLSLVFTVPSASEEVDTHHTLCKEILFIYNYFAVELSSKLTKDTWYAHTLYRYTHHDELTAALTGRCCSTPC